MHNPTIFSVLAAASRTAPWHVLVRLALILVLLKLCILISLNDIVLEAQVYHEM